MQTLISGHAGVFFVTDIAGGIVTNSGTIRGTGGGDNRTFHNGFGVDLGGGGAVANLSDGLITALDRGVNINAGGATLANAGAIVATGGSGIGIYLGNGGTISNGVGFDPRRGERRLVSTFAGTLDIPERLSGRVFTPRASISPAAAPSTIHPGG